MQPTYLIVLLLKSILVRNLKLTVIDYIENFRKPHRENENFLQRIITFRRSIYRDRAVVLSQ